MRRILTIVCCAMMPATAGLLLCASPLSAQSGAWIATGSMNSARSGAAAVLLRDGRILITGGSDASGPSRTAELFGSSGSFSMASPMNIPRSGHVAVVLQDGRVLVAGGVTSGGAATNTAEIFNPVANTWTNVTGGMLEARSGHTAALLRDGRVLIAGGNNGTLISSTVERFDPGLGRFTAAGTMSSPRTRQAMTVLADGRALIVGGSNGTAPVASSDIFDPVAGTVSAGPNLSVARFAHSATTLLNGLVVVIGGNDGNANPALMDLTPAELLDPAAATPAFTTLASNLSTLREGHLAFLLPNNNNVLILGGTSGGASVASAEFFLPQQSTLGVWMYAFGPTGSMGTARGSASGAANQVSSPSSVAQANGMLLVAGGKDANGNALNSAELYGFATVQTDRSDYAPGATVNITGSGWQPGETVKIQFVESPLFDTHGPYSFIADASGNISDRSFTTDAHDASVKFTLTAVGSVSRAQTTFTDAANFTISVSITSNVTGIASPGFSAITGTPGLYQYIISDTANTPSSIFPKTTQYGDLLVGYAGTQLLGSQTSGSFTGSPVTLSDGTAMTQCSSSPCNYTTSDSYLNTRLWTGNAAGGTQPTIMYNTTSPGKTIGGSIYELTGVNALDQIGTNQMLSSNGSTLSSPTITTRYANEVILCLAQEANPIAGGNHMAGMNGASSNWTGLSFGNQGMAYLIAYSPGNYSCTINLGSGATEDYTITIASFYAASAASYSIAAANASVTYSSNAQTVWLPATVTSSSGTVNSGSVTFTVLDGGTIIGSATSGSVYNGSVGVYYTLPARATAKSYTVQATYYPASGSSVTDSSRQLAVYPATLTYVANGVSRAYGAANPTFTGSVIGFTGSDTQANSTSGSLTFTSPATTSSTAGSYPINGSGLTANSGNYTFVQAASNATGLTITSSSSSSSSGSVTFNNTNSPVVVFGSTAFSKPMTVNTGGSNTVAFATVWVDEGSGAAGTTFNVTATYGGQPMTSAGPTSYDYNYAPISSQVFYLVNPPTGTNTLAISATASSGTIQEIIANLVSFNGVNQTGPVRPGTYQTLHSPSNITVGSFTATISSNASDLTLGAVEQTFHFASPASNQIVDSGMAGNYAIGSDHAAGGAASVADVWTFTNPYAYFAYVGFSIQPVNGPALTYTATPIGRTYGAVNPAFTGSVTGFVGTDTQANSTTGTLTFTSAATSSSNVGSYAINGSGLTANGGKYTFTQAPGNATAFAVTPATLTYTANAASRTYGAANPALTGSVAGFVGSDTQANATTGTMTFTSPATATSNVGSYAISGSGLAANNGNYTFAQAPGNATLLTITQATPTVTVGGTFTFDGNPHAATATAVGADGHTLVSGSFTYIYTPSGTSTPPASLGTYAVVASFTSSDPNYTNATGSGSITISASAPAPVTVNNANAAVASFGSATYSKPMTVNAGGSNTVAFATVWVDEGSGAAGTTFNVTATYGGQPMTSAGPTSYDYNYAPISSQVFYLVNPPTGTNTLAISATASSGTIQEVVANLVSFNGVSQTTPVRSGTYQTLHSAASTTVGSFTGTITSNAKDLTLGAVEQTFHFSTPASNQTVDGTSAANFAVASDHSTAGAPSISDTWSFTNPYAYYAFVGFSIQSAN